eukprot:364092-Chlamydomonas_euryale.AAC.9
MSLCPCLLAFPPALSPSTAFRPPADVPVPMPSCSTRTHDRDARQCRRRDLGSRPHVRRDQQQALGRAGAWRAHRSVDVDRRLQARAARVEKKRLRAARGAHACCEGKARREGRRMCGRMCLVVGQANRLRDVGLLMVGGSVPKTIAACLPAHQPAWRLLAPVRAGRLPARRDPACMPIYLPASCLPVRILTRTAHRPLARLPHSRPHAFPPARRQAGRMHAQRRTCAAAMSPGGGGPPVCSPLAARRPPL